MYRLSSSSIVSSEEYIPNISSSSSSSTTTTLSNQNHVVLDQLPTYNPQSHVAKKEKNRIRSAEHAIHFIPLLLMLCAIILWIFSSPVDVVSKDDSLVARVTNSITSGNTKEDGAERSLNTDLNQGNFNLSHQSVDQANYRSRR